MNLFDLGVFQFPACFFCLFDDYQFLTDSSSFLPTSVWFLPLLAFGTFSPELLQYNLALMDPAREKVFCQAPAAQGKHLLALEQTRYSLRPGVQTLSKQLQQLMLQSNQISSRLGVSLPVHARAATLVPPPNLAGASDSTHRKVWRHSRNLLLLMFAYFQTAVIHLLYGAFESGFYDHTPHRIDMPLDYSSRNGIHASLIQTLHFLRLWVKFLANRSLDGKQPTLCVS